MSQVQRMIPRSEVAQRDTWDLASLYPSNQAWEEDFEVFRQIIENYSTFRGRLGEGPKVLAECLNWDLRVDRLAEKLGTYAFLRTTEDQACDQYQSLIARFQNVAVKASQLSSFIRPEILALSEEQIAQAMQAPELKDLQLVLERIHRYRVHTLSDSEESLLALQGEMAQTASKVFRQLNDADLKFGNIEDEQGQTVELSNSNFSQFLICPQRSVRQAAFHQYYLQFQAHENTLAATLAGSVHADVYYARARNYSSSLQAALFPDNVPASVYENLIASVRSQLPAVHEYLEIRRRKMGIDDLHHYDTYVPIVSDVQQTRTWEQAVETVIASLQPLGEEYCRTLQAGLSGRWCDRYPNQGKQSGAFSCGTFDADPYILMNYKPAVLNDLFTLTHEAGHSMHSFYSAKQQPYQYYNYTIFVAEVASTFNEQLLAQHLLNTTSDDRLRAALINHEVDSIRATVVRQTMFAEFEKNIHDMAEAGEPLTVESFKSVYRSLLKDYFGPNFVIDSELELECFRIPHFYRAFYVYKYATGLAAAIALSRRVLEGGQQELGDYLQFLSSGCSRDPLDLLAAAGVDMTSPQPVATALQHFGHLVKQLDELTH